MIVLYSVAHCELVVCTPFYCSVKDIVHERTWLKGSIYDVAVRVYIHL